MNPAHYDVREREGCAPATQAVFQRIIAKREGRLVARPWWRECADFALAAALFFVCTPSGWAVLAIAVLGWVLQKD